MGEPFPTRYYDATNPTHLTPTKSFMIEPHRHSCWGWEQSRKPIVKKTKKQLKDELSALISKNNWYDKNEIWVNVYKVISKNKQIRFRH